MSSSGDDVAEFTRKHSIGRGDNVLQDAAKSIKEAIVASTGGTLPSEAGAAIM